MEVQLPQQDEIVSFPSPFKANLCSYLRFKLQDLFLDYRLVNRKVLLQNIQNAFAHSSRNFLFFLNSRDVFCLAFGKKAFLDFFGFAMNFLRLKEKRNSLLANNLVMREIRLCFYDTFIGEIIQKQTKFLPFLRWLKARRVQEACKSIPHYKTL